MPSNIANPTPITPPRVALIDPRTGLIERSWYMFFLSLFDVANSDDADNSPNTASLLASYDAAIRTLAQEVQTQPQSELVDQVAELQKQVQGLELTPQQLINQIAELQKQVQGLQMAPPPRQFERSRYGSFYDTTTQVAAVINTATLITFNTTDLSRGVYLDNTLTSRVYVDTSGIYNFQTSIQLDSTVATAQEFYLWFRLNGVDVTNSASQMRVQGNNAEVFVALNYFFDLNAGDYVELVFSVSNLGVQLLASTAVAPHPGIPSVILTVSNNIGGIQ
jgi:hypothetical protein